MTTFWKPGTAKPGSSLDRSGEGDNLIAQPSLDLSGGLQGQRSRLPIAKQRDEILFAVEQYKVLVVIGQTGSGKTTQIPQYLMEAGWAAGGRQIAITQPRRISATSVAQRVAQEVGCVIGDEVGYTIRFEDLTNEHRTRIKYCTDGILFRECMRDPLLSKYSVIMVDEAHERGAYTDMLLGLLKKIQKRRPELRVIISSATIDAQMFVDFFRSCDDDKDVGSMTLQGRTFPVEIAYLDKPCRDYIDAAVDAVWNIHLTQPIGDILVFLTGREEIDKCLQAIADRLLNLPKGSLLLSICPLHAGLTIEEQTDVFKPTERGTRKCIVATNIAEASITIEGIRYVIDSGFVKMRLFNPQNGMDSLSVLPISKASATQRAGRAGRTSSGKCLRLYTHDAFERMSPISSSEMTRTDLSNQILQLKALGIENLVKFDYLPPAPPSALLARGLESLAALGALDDWGRLTSPLGEQMAEMPLEPKMAKVLLESIKFQCTQEILSVAAMTSVSTPFIIPDEGRSAAGAQGELERRKFTAEEGDHLTLLNVFNAFINPRLGNQSSKWCANHRLNFRVLSRAVNIRSQLEKFLSRFGIRKGGESCKEDSVRLRKCLTSGYFGFAAKMQPDGSFRSIREGATLYVHPSSVMFNRSPSTKWVIFHEVVETQKLFIRDLTVIEEDWLLELAPHYYQR